MLGIYHGLPNIANSPQRLGAGVYGPVGIPAPSLIPTDYANPLGTGNRTASITVTETSVGTLAAANFGLVDGITGAGFNYFFGAWSPGETIRFDLGTPKRIDQFRWIQDLAASHGQWMVEGSNDAVAWTPVSNTFTLGGATPTTTHDLDLIGGSDTYRYYRLNFVSGVVSAGPYIREIEFRVSA